RAVIESIEALGDDPFQGARSRHVARDNMSPTDMEARAAAEAIERAGIGAADIDLLLVYTSVPDYLLSSTACLLHDRLGLAPKCLSMEVNAASNSFLMQLTNA